MTENLGGLCMNCARTAWTPGVGAADAGSQAHAGLRDRLCLESRATFASRGQKYRTVRNFQEGHAGAAGSDEAWPFRGIMAARKQVRCGPDMYGHNLPAAHVGVFAH